MSLGWYSKDMHRRFIGKSEWAVNDTVMKVYRIKDSIIDWYKKMPKLEKCYWWLRIIDMYGLILTDNMRLMGW